MPSSLSPEIWDQIIDHLHDNKPTLSACTLVHRSWTTSARLHLFYRIIIDDRNMDNLSIVFPQSGGALDHYIRDFRIAMDRIPLLPIFPSLTSLTLSSDEPWEQWPPLTQRWLLEQLKEIHMLRLSLDIGDIENTLQLIAAAKSLKTLFYVNDMFVHECNSPQIFALFELYAPPHIGDFTAGHSRKEKAGVLLAIFLLRWIKHHNANDKLKTFQICGDWKRASKEISQCLTETAPLIENLVFDDDATSDLCEF